MTRWTDIACILTLLYICYRKWALVWEWFYVSHNCCKPGWVNWRQVCLHSQSRLLVALTANAVCGTVSVSLCRLYVVFIKNIYNEQLVALRYTMKIHLKVSIISLCRPGRIICCSLKADLAYWGWDDCQPTTYMVVAVWSWVLEDNCCFLSKLSACEV